jgi:fatty-acyl-CoA synthase
MPKPTASGPWPAGLPRHLSVPATGLADNLDVSARRYPGKMALHFHGRDMPYAELARRVRRLATHLASVGGVRSGDRVLLMMQNSPAFVCACYAILRLGAVVVPVNPMNRTEELRWIVSDSGARVACLAQDLWAQLAPLRDEGLLDHAVLARYGTDLPDLPVPDVAAGLDAPRLAIDGPGLTWLEDIVASEGRDVTTDAARQAQDVRNAGACGEDLAVLAYTSGTTGQPKGCMLSHRALQAAAACLLAWNRWTPDAVALATAPFFHVTGMVGSMHVPLLCGAAIVLLPRWDRAAAAQLIAQQQVSHWTNVPTMVSDLLALPDLQGDALASLSYIGGGGSAMPSAVAERLHALTDLAYQEGWGLTEVAGAIHLNPPGAERRQCLGVPTFGVDTRVVAVDGSGGEVPPGESGELVTRCPSLFSGYWRNPEATQQAFLTLHGERYFRTGDIGRVDADGYFHLADRLKRMINASGYKVWPAEVESLLYRHPAVQEACVVGSPDAHRGETVKAFVVLRSGLAEPPSAQALVDWAREHMAAYKVPRRIAFVDALPRSGTGKILWRQLQEAERGSGG